MFKKYLTKDGPPEPKLVKKTVEVPKIKVELHFVGKNGEMEKYVEKYEGRVTVSEVCMAYWIESVEETMFNLTINSDAMRNPKIFLENNNRMMNLEYFTLTKAVILDTKMVEKEIEVYE